MSRGRIVVGLSGGVDSSVAAYLLKEQGYDVIGVTMVNFPESRKLVEDAARVADYLGVPHHVADFCQPFQEQIIDYFTGEYLRGRTPNPCVICNRCIKWQGILAEGEKLGARLLATGHYAGVEQLANGRYAVKRCVNAAKDQTYALFGLSQEQLSRTLMPLGQYSKDEIREIARRIGLPVANKPDSMEICFIPDKDYANYITQHTDKVIEPGNYVNTAGEVIGRHKGIIHYTVGQRKGLNLAMGHPVFVTEIRPWSNEVVIGENEDIFAKALICDQLNPMSVPEFTDGMKVTAKIRYNHKGAAAVLRPLLDGELRVEFEEGQRAVTPGQAVAFYQGDHVAGGGIIKGAVNK